MDSWANDWIFLENAVDNLKDYLLSDQLFWPLYSGKRLTLGNLRLAQRKLSSYLLPGDIQTRKDEYDQLVEENFLSWRSNWSKKAQKEFQARLRQWEQFLREITSQKRSHGLTYAHEVASRVILELLKDELINPLQNEYDRLLQLDTRLRSLVKPGDFIWDRPLINNFPETEYWFLYAQLVK